MSVTCRILAPMVMSVLDNVWANVNRALNVSEQTTLEDFVDIDEDAAVSGTLKLDEIIASCSSSHVPEDEVSTDDEDSTIKYHVDKVPVRIAVTILRSYFEKSEITQENSDQIFSAVATMDGIILNGTQIIVLSL
ncbi:hypothetical protein QAD02_019373 [Eretmocerus hayati]|uniref:Uncharacterized protein n=1 Tax=Eretmocerus hayati TaxID=131215 RepID=A0ACC2PKM3_9HYME|nr:hypothetical protein QAD02_019373 [Eretmocerus hayati]